MSSSVRKSDGSHEARSARVSDIWEMEEVSEGGREFAGWRRYYNNEGLKKLKRVEGMFKRQDCFLSRIPGFFLF